MSLIQINWHPSRKELRLFGLAMILGFAAIGAILYLKGLRTAGVCCLAFGVVAGLLGLSGTRAALPFYRAWMALALVVGGIMGRVVLGIVYYGLITPIGLTRRLLGKDRLGLKRRQRSTYWQDVPPTSESYERQF